MPLLFAGALRHTGSMDNFTAPRAPAPDTIAAFVKLQRAFYGWKRETLAALAKVSLSTVERVERGETVRASSLEKLALALNQPHDAFTAVRVPLSPERALASLADSFSWMDGMLPVDVAPLRHESQLRALSDTEVVLVASDNLVIWGRAHADQHKESNDSNNDPPTPGPGFRLRFGHLPPLTRNIARTGPVQPANALERPRSPCRRCELAILFHSGELPWAHRRISRLTLSCARQR